MKRLVLILVIMAAALPALADDRGPLVSIELRDVEVSDMLRAIGQEHQINIVVDESVTGRVTVSLRNVPLWDAIESILKGKGYTYVRDGSIVRVVKSADDEDLVTRTVSVSYANPKEIESILRKMLSKRGEVASDARSNAVIIKDLPSHIPRAVALVKALDGMPAQVMIEAKIVEVNTKAKKELGIQWGAMYQRGDVLIFGGATKQKSSDVDVIALTEGIGVMGTAFNVNLPAAVGEGAGGAIGLGILAKNFALDLQLSALEESGLAKVLSSPKVLVADNQEATIASGTQIIIRNDTASTVVNTGAGSSSGGSTSVTGVTEKEAALRLTVTPRVVEPGQVALRIATKKEEFDFTRAVLDVPPKTTRETQTNLILRDGDTIVIGGIYEEKDFSSENGVPLLSKIPLLGWLFKKEAEQKDRTELLIFITPSILREEFGG